MRIFTIILLFTLFSCGQEKPKQINSQLKQSINKNEGIKETLPVSIPTTDTSGLIEGIKDEFQRINALKLSETTVPFQCEQNEGDVTYFLNKDEIVKIKIEKQWLGDDYQSHEYYYKDGRYIFDYSVSETGATGHTVINEFRTYIHNNKTIRYMEDKTIKPCKVCEFSSSSLPYKLLRAYQAKQVKEEISQLLCGQ